jgi:hypothetical protein
MHATRAADIQEGMMAKFYVQSGSFQGVVDSYDAECAAVWAIHRVMACEPTTTRRREADSSLAANEPSAEIGLFRLGDEIGISERGFGRRDAQRIPTKDAFLKWVQLVHTVEVLRERLDDACERQS